MEMKHIASKVYNVAMASSMEAFNNGEYEIVLDFSYKAIVTIEDYLSSKLFKYGLSFNDYLNWSYYMSNVKDMDAELICDKKTIKTRYDYYAMRMPSNRNTDFFNALLDINTVRFVFNNEEYHISLDYLKNAEYCTSCIVNNNTRPRKLSFNYPTCILYRDIDKKKTIE